MTGTIIRVNSGATDYERTRVNLLGSGGATVTVADDAANDEIDVTLGGSGYTLHVGALTSDPTDGQTTYFGGQLRAPTTTAAIAKVYIQRAGTIKAADVIAYSATAGTNENWTLNIRLNNTTDTAIATVGAATNERRFTNQALAIAVVVGDYIEIKSVQPTWATNPLGTTYGGTLYIE